MNQFEYTESTWLSFAKITLIIGNFVLILIACGTLYPRFFEFRLMMAMLYSIPVLPPKYEDSKTKSSKNIVYMKTAALKDGMLLLDVSRVRDPNTVPWKLPDLALQSPILKLSTSAANLRDFEEKEDPQKELKLGDGLKEIKNSGNMTLDDYKRSPKKRPIRLDDYALYERGMVQRKHESVPFEATPKCSTAIESQSPSLGFEERNMASLMELRDSELQMSTSEVNEDKDEELGAKKCDSPTNSVSTAIPSNIPITKKK